MDASEYRVPDNLAGARVLDVGAWDGFWSFEALRRGAASVVAIDDFSDLLGALKPGERRGWQTFDLCRELLGYSPEQCARAEMSVYDLTPERFGRFDVVFCFGVLYHLRHPLLALDRLAGVCDDSLFVESIVCDDYSPYRGGAGKGYPGGQMIAEFYPDDQYAANPTNWWAPTLHCLAHLVRSAGFATVDAWRPGPRNPYAAQRGYASGRKRRT